MKQTYLLAALILAITATFWGCASNKSPTSTSLPEGYSLFSFFGSVSTMDNPIGVAVAGGLVWVGQNGGSLQAWTPEGTRQVNTTTSLGAPVGVSVGPDGYIYVADLTLLDVAEFNPFGGYVTSFGSAQADSSGVYGVQVNSQYAYLIQADSAIRFTITGTGDSKVFGSPITFADSGAGAFIQGNQASLDASGNLYVADLEKGILKYNSSGTYQMSVTLADSGQACDVAARSDGHLFAADMGNAEIQEFTSAGLPVTTFGNTELANAASLYFGLAFDAQNNLFVTNPFSNQVYEFSPQ